MRYTRFERARIIGARALQISMGAPTLAGDLTDLMDPLTIATHEFERSMIPVRVQRFPDALH